MPIDENLFARIHFFFTLPLRELFKLKTLAGLARREATNTSFLKRETV